MQPITAQIDIELERIADCLEKASNDIENGQFTDLSALQTFTLRATKMMHDLPDAQAANYARRLQDIIADLDQLIENFERKLESDPSMHQLMTNSYEKNQND